ncbi:ATPase [Aureococcus anophagefferens]|nr:ATPase [Aureococcus anophagefferens]
MVGFGSTAGNRSHRWDAKFSVAGTRSSMEKAGEPRVWRGAGAFRDPNKRDGVAAHNVAGGTTRLIDVYEAPLRRVDELLGVRVDEFTPKLGYTPRLSATFVSGYEKSYDPGASGRRAAASGGASFARETTADAVLARPPSELEHLARRVRGARRAEERVERRASRMAAAALDKRREQVLRRGLAPGLQARRSARARRADHPAKVPRAAVERATLLRRAATADAAPSGPAAFRRVPAGSARRGAARPRRREAAEALRVLPRADAAVVRRRARGADERARGRAGRRRRAIADLGARARYGIRAEIVAKSLVTLASGENRAPGHGRILELAELLRATAGENPDPSVLSRAQFVVAYLGALRGFSARDAHVFFSSLDPGASTARCGASPRGAHGAHRSGASSLTLDPRDRVASKTARHVCPLLRSIAEAYDPEHDGVQPAEVRELLCACAVSRDDAARVEALVARTPALNTGAPLTGEALCDVPGPEARALLAEFNRQLEAYRTRSRARGGPRPEERDGGARRRRGARGAGAAQEAKKAKKAKKGGAAGAAALEALEALETLEAAEAPAVEAVEAPPAKKEKQAAEAPAAAEAPEPAPAVAEAPAEAPAKLSPKEAKKAALLAALDDFDDFEEDVVMRKTKKKKEKKEKKGKKGKQEAVAEDAAEEEAAFAAPTAAADADDGLTLEERRKRERGSAKVRVIERSGSGAAGVRLEGISVVFKNTEVLKDATWGVNTGDRVGLVGANGGGKTTQLKVLAGELEPAGGDVVLSRADVKICVKIAYLRQEFSESLDLARTLREELASVFVEEAAVLASLDAMEAKLRAAAGALEFERLQERAGELDAYAIEGRAEKVAIQMGFGDDDLDALVGSFSGGWKMRVGLAKVLLEKPDVLLLDEPTNHLDLESVEWLEAFLREQTLAMVIVSHDREFLDQVCSRIVDTDQGVCTSYDGNYSKFLKAKRERLKQWEAAYKRQQSKIQEDRNFINKNPRGLEGDKKGLRFRFPEPPRCGVDILSCDDVAHGYGDQQLFSGVSFELRKRDRVAVLGANGAGKSTLLRVIADREASRGGENQADALDLSKTVIQTIEDASALGAEKSYNELRALLGQFLFKGDDVHKKLESLSGGEKARVALCCMMLVPANVLFLDEPTNHLDIPAKEMLEDALRHFDGTVVVVSHDRYFVSQVANTIFTIENRAMSRFDGDYASYMDARDDLRDRVENRYVAGGAKINKARFVDLDALAADEKKKKIGGKLHGGSGRKDKA